MTIMTRLLLASALVALPRAGASQNTRFSDPDTVIKEQFWGQLYRSGGTSFFCNKTFTSKGFLLTDGYIYPLSHVRSALRCGTPSQCSQDPRYQQIASDLHNIVPVHARIELRRRNAIYEELDDGIEVRECGIRESAQFMEPPAGVKGDIARAVGYMVDAYSLPWVGADTVFKAWNEQDPPDDRELTRHRQIVELQGNENRFVTDPGSLARL